MIALEKLAWQGVADYQPGYERGFPRTLSGVRQIESFPVILNSVFQIERGDQLRQFSLRTSVQLSESDLQNSQALYFPWIGEAWEVYWNGQLLQNELYLNEQGTQLKARRIFRRMVVPIRPDALRIGPNDLFIHFAGYQAPGPLENNTNSGLVFKDGYFAGSLDRLLALQSRTFNLVLLTSFLFFGIYHIFIYFKRYQDRYNLFFGLFSIGMALDLFTGLAYAHTVFFDTSWVNRLKYASQASLVSFYMLFLHHYFHSSAKLRFSQKLIIAHTTVMALGFLLLPFRYSESWLIIFQLGLLPVLIVIFLQMLRLLLERRKDSLLLFGSTLAMALGVVYDIMDDMFLKTGMHIAPYMSLSFQFSLVLFIANRFLRVQSESEQLNIELARQKEAFHRFVPTEFLEHLGRNSPGEILPGDSNFYEMSVLFCDMRSFTRISEDMSPSDTFAFLNGYLRRLVPIIQQYRGFVDKYVGDAILALFSERDRKSPDGLNPAESAVQAAIAMCRLSTGPDWKQMTNNVGPLFGIGINTGPLVMGTVGSSKRLDTTVIGDTVNIASRLEHLSALYHSRI
ncbi:MAG: adenylate/guanylate cyclase domain-containing protein, partial [Leptospiraceae bacterium]|nr:adenylate/guanylate cyclase domain-containing protein [Leptospiraceae bacterium]